MRLKELAVKTFVYGFTGGFIVYALLSKYWYAPVGIGLLVAGWLWWGTVKWIIAAVIGFYGVIILLILLLAIVGYVAVKANVDPKLTSAAEETFKSRLD